MTNHIISRFMILSDDDEASAKWRSYLGKLRYESFTIIDNGEEALSLIEPKRIQFIIVNWEMDPMNGSAFCQRLRASDKFRHIPVLIFSKNLSDEEFEIAQCFKLDNLIEWPCVEDEAIQIIQTMVAKEEALDPSEVAIRESNIFLLDREFSQAKAVLNPALKEEAYFPEAQTLMADINYKEGNIDAAEERLNDLFEKKADPPQARHLMARIYSKTKRHEKAIDLLEKTTIKQPFDINALMNLGIAYDESGQPDKAEAAFMKAQEKDPTNQDIKKKRSSLAFKIGKFEMAASILESVHDMSQVARDFNNIAVGLIAKKRFTDGIKSYKAALGIIQDSDDIYHLMEYNLGLAYRKDGDLKKAFNVLSKVFQKNQDFTKSYAALVKVVKEMQTQSIPYDKELMLKLKKINASKAS